MSSSGFMDSDFLPSDFVNCTGLRFCLANGAAPLRWVQNTNARVDADNHVYEMAVEFNVPLLKDVTGFKDLALNLAGRRAKYSTFDAGDSWKLGLNWQIVDSVRLRSTHSSDFRAPNLNDLYQPAGVTSTGFQDRLTGGSSQGMGVRVVGDSSDHLPEMTTYGPNGDTSRYLDPSIIGSHVLVRLHQENSDTIKQARFKVTWGDDTLKLDAGLSYLDDNFTLQNSNSFTNNFWQAYAGYGAMRLGRLLQPAQCLRDPASGLLEQAPRLLDSGGQGVIERVQIGNGQGRQHPAVEPADGIADVGDAGGHRALLYFKAALPDARERFVQFRPRDRPRTRHRPQQVLACVRLHVRKKHLSRAARDEVDDGAQSDGQVGMPLLVFLSQDHQALDAGANHEVACSAIRTRAVSGRRASRTAMGFSG